MIVRYLIILTLFLLAGCDQYELTIAGNIDLKRLQGKWYEIAANPQSSSRKCICTTAEYTLTPKYLAIKNTCYTKSKNKLTSYVENARAFPISKTNNSHFKVELTWPLKGELWIAYIDPDYQEIAIGLPNRKYVWILSRSPVMDPISYDRLLITLAFYGFDISKLRQTDQSCNLPDTGDVIESITD
jgi:apolipoprotein D and lipocalin family protein